MDLALAPGWALALLLLCVNRTCGFLGVESSACSESYLQAACGAEGAGCQAQSLP